MVAPEDYLREAKWRIPQVKAQSWLLLSALWPIEKAVTAARQGSKVLRKLAGGERQGSNAVGAGKHLRSAFFSIARHFDIHCFS